MICLVGERGREVREFVERDLGAALPNSVVVVSTSDQPALVRIKAALTATTIAEWFRDQGFDVMLMMDSVTRFAMAQREVGLAIGEPPATRGYTPSVFALLPKLLERSGTSDKGSITALYTVLVDGDDMNEPIADAVRSILDGHIVLTRELAHSGHYPAVDVLQSVSRLVSEVTADEVRLAAMELRQLLAAYRDKADLIAIGAYEQRDRPAGRSRRPAQARDRRVPAPGPGRARPLPGGRRAHGGNGRRRPRRRARRCRDRSLPAARRPVRRDLAGGAAAAEHRGLTGVASARSDVRPMPVDPRHPRPTTGS